MKILTLIIILTIPLVIYARGFVFVPHFSPHIEPHETPIEHPSDDDNASHDDKSDSSWGKGYFFPRPFYYYHYETNSLTGATSEINDGLSPWAIFIAVLCIASFMGLIALLTKP